MHDVIIIIVSILTSLLIYKVVVWVTALLFILCVATRCTLAGTRLRCLTALIFLNLAMCSIWANRCVGYE